jgi:hypothetical protein
MNYEDKWYKDKPPLERIKIAAEGEITDLIEYSWSANGKLEWSIGKELSMLKEAGEWKKDEIFILKSGKNKGELDKKPKFDKWLKKHCEKKWEEWRKYRSLMLWYEGKIKAKKYHKEALKNLIEFEQFMEGMQ